MCMAYRASFRHILKKKVTVCFSSSVCNDKMLLTFACLKENSDVSLEEFSVFTTATRKL